MILGAPLGLDQKALNGGLDSCRWFLQVISFRLAPNLTDLEKCDLEVPVGFDQKTSELLLMGVYKAAVGVWRPLASVWY